MRVFTDEFVELIVIFVMFISILIGSRFIFTEYAYKKVTFSVGLDHHFHATNGETVMYNDIILNSNAYNTLTGRFTAPLDGTYIFHYHGLAQNNQVI